VDPQFHAAWGIAADDGGSIYTVGGTGNQWPQEIGEPKLPFSPPADATFVLKLSQPTARADTVTLTSDIPVVYSSAQHQISLWAQVSSPAGVNEGQVRFTLLDTFVYAPVVNGEAHVPIFVVPGGTPSGNHLIQADYEGTGAFAASSDTKLLMIAKASPNITWPNPAAVQFGSALGAMQLNAAANVSGTFTYSPPAGTVLPVGSSQVLSTVFTPADQANYVSASGSTAIDVLAPPLALPAKIVVTTTLARNATNELVVTLALSNVGGSSAANVQLRTAKVGQTPGVPLPIALGSLPAGATISTTVTFPATAGTPGARTTLTFAGVFAGGSFQSTSQQRLPLIP
jgi:hypothetical protein